MTTVNYGHSHASGVTVEDTLVQDKLFDRETITRKVIIRAGAMHVRGELLGKATKGVATSAVKASGANTGTGTFVIDGATPVLANATPGLHTLRCITAAANGGRFELKNPMGVSLGIFDLPGTAGGSVGIADRIKGVLSDSATDFVVGDGFDITVAAGTLKYDLSATTAVDGTEEVDAILLHDADATLSDQEAIVAIAGRFAAQGIVFGAGHSFAEADNVLRTKDIFLENIVG